MSAARGDELLHQRGRVQTQIQLSCLRRFLELAEVVEPLDPGAAAADVGLDHDREPQALRRLGGVVGRIDHPRLGVGKTELFQQLKLEGFRSLVAKSLLSVHHTATALLEVGKVVKGVKDPLAVTTPVSRRAHAIEDQRIIAFSVQLRGIKQMLLRVHAYEGDVPLFERRKQRLKPMRMLVIDGNRLLKLWHGGPRSRVFLSASSLS